MNIVDVAECLSAFAAFMTVCLAVIELSSRSKIKKADIAIEIYADYLHVKQQLEYIVGSIESFVQKCSDRTSSEISTYAKTHIIDQALFATVTKIEKDSICNFDYSSRKNKAGKSNSKQILVFSGGVINLMISVNTFYQALIEDGNISVNLIRKTQENINALYSKLIPEIESTGELLRENLVKTHNYSNTYLILLILSALVFFALVFIL